VVCVLVFLGFLVRLYFFFLVLRHQTMDKVQKYTSIPLGDINTEAWSSGMGVGRGANNPTL
jgi:hypothetical protein